MKNDILFIEPLKEILTMQGIEIDDIHSETIVVGMGACIDSLTLALLLIKIEEITKVKDLSNKLMSLPGETVSLADITNLIGNM